MTEKNLGAEVELTGLKYSVHAHEECALVGAMTPGYDEICSRLQSGDVWAWCVVEVRAEIGAFRGSAFLGGCSYLDKQDFIDNSAYYEDMKSDAMESLTTQVEICSNPIVLIRDALSQGLAHFGTPERVDGNPEAITSVCLNYLPDFFRQVLVGGLDQ